MRTRADVFWIKFLQPLLGDAGKQFIFFDGQRDSQSVSAESVEVVLNMSYFFKAFRKIFKATPTDYRKNLEMIS